MNIADNLRRQIQKTPPWARPLVGLLTALVVSVLSPIIILWFIGVIAWDVTFGE